MALMTAMLANSPLKLSPGFCTRAPCKKPLLSAEVRSHSSIGADSSAREKNPTLRTASPPPEARIYENAAGLGGGRGGSGTGLGLGLGLGLGFGSQALALEEIAKIAANDSSNDSRGLLLLVVLAPAVGWVLFNILRPALNQLDRMRSSSKAVIGGGIGIGAMSSLLSSSSQQSDAEAMAMAMASPIPDEIASLAASADNDSRGLLLLIVLAPAIGWVLFNILRPALNQLDKMRGK